MFCESHHEAAPDIPLHSMAPHHHSTEITQSYRLATRVVDGSRLKDLTSKLRADDMYLVSNERAEVGTCGNPLCGECIGQPRQVQDTLSKTIICLLCR